MAVNITAAPNVAVNYLTKPKRSGGVFSTTWKVPASATNTNNAARWTGISVVWSIDYGIKINGVQKIDTIKHSLPTDYTSDSITLTTSTLFPNYPSGLSIKSVSVRVCATNGIGSGPDANYTLTMLPPAKPEVELSFDSTNGRVTCTVTAENVDGARHRYDDVVSMRRSGAGGASMLVDGSAGTSTERTFTRDISNASTLTAGKYVRIVASAFNRGMGGAGDKVTETLFIAHPNRPTCGDPSISFATRGVYATASVIVPVNNPGVIKTSDGIRIYPTTVKLQRLKDSSSTTAEDASSESGWADVSGATDGGTCAGLVDAWADGVSQDGLRTWYRVAAIRDGYTQYGLPKFAKRMYSAAPTVQAGTATIASAASNAAGTAISVDWKRKSFSNGGGIEFSWSTSSTAWSDTSGPSTYELTTNSKTGTRTISSLTANTKYYVRVRGFAVRADGTKKYGSYSKTYGVTVEASTGTSAITSITATSDRTGAKLVMSKQQANDAIEISWSEKYYAWTSNDGPDTALTTTGGTTKTWYVYGLEPGVQYYFRVRSVDGTTYGAYSSRTAFTIDPKAATVGAATVTSATTGVDGQTVKVALSKSEANDGMQLSWADDERAWDSTDGPTVYAVEEFDGKRATVYVQGLTEGTPYYFRARCYDETGDERIFGEWCEPKSATPYGAPGAVSATFPDFVPVGKSMAVSWAHESSSRQLRWRVVIDGKTAASGSDLREAATVSRSYMNGLSAGTHSAYVSVTTGTGWANSDTQTFSIVSRPNGTLATISTLTAQPLSLSLLGSGSALSLMVTVTAEGCAADELHDAQPTGLVLWSGTIDGIAWTASDDEYAATVSLPATIDLRDGASYTVSAVLVDGSTGLSKTLRQRTFAVAWSHQAGAPTVAVTPNATDLTASIAVTAPSGAAQTDVCDVYRVTPDGSYLIAEGRALGSTIVDAYAPYVERDGQWVPFYRVATRTADGDVEYADATYELRSDRIRVDWGDSRHVELEYALAGSDAWSKDFSAVTHIDGTVGGTWSSGVKRTSKLSGILVRVSTPEEQAALRELARHAGPAFVRTSNGCAYTAHVDVSNMSWSAKTFQLSASITAQELTLLPEFMASTNVTTTTTGA